MRQPIPPSPTLYGACPPLRRPSLPALGILAAALAGLWGCGSLESSQAPQAEDRRADLLALRITEIHYHPADEGGVAGDDFEFIEIKNTGPTALDLTQVGFTGGIDHVFADGTTLPPGGFLVLAAIASRFQALYGFAPEDVYTGTLGNSGEAIVLQDLAAHSVIDTVTYSDKDGWPATADGGGHSLVPVSAGERAMGWRASFRRRGSPGRDDLMAVVVNEVSSHTDPPATDAIELHNPSDAAVDVGGWWLSDDSADAAKFRIPDGTIIRAGGYIHFDERDFNVDSSSSRSFRLSAHGDDVWLSADSGGCAKGYCDGVAFGEMPNGVTAGRHTAGDGSVQFVIQSQASLGEANAGPRIGPVILSEIMYHSPNDTDDYLEVANVAGQPLDLFDRDRPDNTWKIEGLGFRFPKGVTLAPGEIVLVLPVRASEDRVRAAYGVPADVRIFQSEGDLRNGSETLVLLKPEEPYLKPDAAPGDSTVPYQIIDKVSYRDGGVWPKSADGEGKALVRKTKDAFGNDAGSWSASDPGPGR